MAEEASAGLQTAAGEVAAARRLDAEDATMRQVLAWAIDHDPETAVRLADALGGGGGCAAGWPASTPCCPSGRARRAGQRRVVRCQGWLGWAAFRR